jgi:2',3'-cyclic-nucleotide 2'-phosphodiesterase (5'-nucleotidase family)
LALMLLAPHGAAGLTVLYSASLNGNLEGCTCGGSQRAGLAVRAAWLRGFPARSEALLVDAGNVVAGTGHKSLAREILGAYADLQYDAVAVGVREITDGVDTLSEYRDRFGLICQNLAVCAGKHCLFLTPDPLLLEKAGEKVGLFALLDLKALSVVSKEVLGNVKLVPPELVAESLVSQLAGEGADWIVVLYHGSLKGAEALARKARGIDLIVVAGEQRLLPPRRVGDALLVSPGEAGNRLGILELWRDARGRRQHSHRFQLYRYGIDPADPQVLERIRRLRLLERR